MEFKDLSLLFQLIHGMENTFEEFEKAYFSSDKEKLDSSKEVLLDYQKKIDIILK